MKRSLPFLGLVALTIVLTREFFPKRLDSVPVVPVIVAVHDTVHDTLRFDKVIRAPAVVTTDTVQLIERETVHDTTFIRLTPTPTEAVTKVWPVLALTVGEHVGDTTKIGTFDLRTGRGAIASVYTPGPLLGVWANGTPTPRLLFGKPPKPAKVGLWTKLKWGAIGYGSCTVANSVARLAR